MINIFKIRYIQVCCSSVKVLIEYYNLIKDRRVILGLIDCLIYLSVFNKILRSIEYEYKAVGKVKVQKKTILKG